MGVVGDAVGRQSTGLLNSPPSFFERLVVKLLVQMGYGGTVVDAG